MIDINKLALEAYPEKLVTVGDNPELWDENEQYRECWIEGYNKALLIPRVSQRSELLKALIDTDIDVDLVSGRKCRLLKHTEESFLIQYNHNDQIEWVGISELNTKSL